MPVDDPASTPPRTRCRDDAPADVQADVPADHHGITLALVGGDRFFSWAWLRDHARDSSSYHAGANQRLVPLSTSTTSPPGVATIEGDELVVDWPDGPPTRLPMLLLVESGRPSEMYDPFAGRQEAWTAAELDGRITSFEAARLDVDDTTLAAALERFRRDGVVLVDDVGLDVTATRRVLERFGYVRMSIFGDVWTFGSDGALDDTASTSLEIEPHTDGTYSHDAPGLLALHCLRQADGGATVIVDGLTVARQVAAVDPRSAEILRTTDIPGRYVGDGAHLVAMRPVLRHLHDRLAQISYNHHDRAPVVLPEPEMGETYAALARFDELTRDPSYRFVFTLAPGQMVLIDNWRVLHGRLAFTGERRMAGGYINREDLESRIRTLAGAEP